MKNLVAHATQLLRENPEYLDDARQGARVGNSVIGSVMSMTTGAPRQRTERAVVEALHSIEQTNQRH